MTIPNSPDLAHLAAFADRLADTAREITMRYFRTPVAVEHKTDRTPVTRADRETETALRAQIARTFPEHAVWGEEFGRTDNNAEAIWVIDPIDGTKAFITGRPTFGTLIAFVLETTPVIGVVETPALAERWRGIQGQATERNGTPCRTSGVQRLDHATVLATTIDMFTGDERTAFDALTDRALFRSFGADCYAYGLLASGFVDLVVEADMAPYDFMAMVPVIAGAGGMVTDWNGAALTLESGGRVLAAASAALHEQALCVLTGK